MSDSGSGDESQDFHSGRGRETRILGSVRLVSKSGT